MKENSRGGDGPAGVVLLAATVIALVAANSVLAPTYQLLLHGQIAIGALHTSWSWQRIVDDGLMTVFFFVVGTEMKHELVTGELRTLRRAALPAMGALGGMIFPVLIFTAVNWHREGIRGWGIPMATDIAFALGCISLVRKHVPHAVVVFLLALAIFDDLGAIVVIGLFYGHGLDLIGCGLAVLLLGVVALMSYGGVRRPVAYLVVGFALWLAVLRSGIHPTLAGVLLGVCIPVGPFERLEGFFKALVSFVILPLFALSNAGVDLGGIGFSALGSPVAIGVILGLCVGKGVGVFLFSFAATRLGISPSLEGARPNHIIGVSMLAGIGFTMSIFIAALSFEPGSALLLQAKLAILVASALSAAAGLLVLRSGRYSG